MTVPWTSSPVWSEELLYGDPMSMTFDAQLFILIGAFAVVGIIIAVPRLIRVLATHRPEIEASVRKVMVGAVIQQSALAIGLAAVGTALAPRIGLGAPWFAAVSHGEGLGWAEAIAQLPTAFAVGAVSTAIFLLLYYRVFRPRMAAADIARTEELRNSMGLMGRLLMGGVTEEVMFRWGMMSTLAWLAVSVVGMPEDMGMWSAIVIAGLLFGLGHLPGVAAVGVKITRLIVIMALGLNMVAAVAFGWLFWQHGLLAAIVAHALLHAVWYPFEKGEGQP